MLTFTQVEHLLGGSLPGSARKSKAFWSNRAGQGTLQAQAWMEAGYHVLAVDFEKETVTFAKPGRPYHVKRDPAGQVVWDGNLIKALREHLGLNQAAFADELGVRQQTISEWESGKYEPSRATAKHLGLVAERAGFNYG